MGLYASYFDVSLQIPFGKCAKCFFALISPEREYPSAKMQEHSYLVPASNGPRLQQTPGNLCCRLSYQVLTPSNCTLQACILDPVQVSLKERQLCDPVCCHNEAVSIIAFAGRSANRLSLGRSAGLRFSGLHLLHYSRPKNNQGLPNSSPCHRLPMVHSPT